MSDRKQVLFVRGGRTPPARPWQYFHFAPNHEVSLGPVRLVYFDYPEGKLKVWHQWTPKRGVREPARDPDEEKDLEPVVETYYRDRETGTVHKGEELPSVLALYDYVKAQLPESIRSLQVFSHGFVDGPIIWGRAVDRQPGDLARDPQDTEFRYVDFDEGNPLSGKEGEKFARAFHPEAFVKLWGCDEEKSRRAMVANYLKAPEGNEGDALRKAYLEAYLKLIEYTYFIKLAQLLRLTVWAAPVGWGSRADYELPYKKKFPPDLDKELWWRMHSFGKAERRFYTDVLRADIDATLYAGYNDAWYAYAHRQLEEESRKEPFQPKIRTPKDLELRPDLELP